MSETNPNGANQYRKCKKCLRTKTLKSFEFRNDNNSFRYICKKCGNKRKSDWYLNNKYSQRTKFVAKKYGLSSEDYEYLINSHKELCAICGQKESSPDGRTKRVKSLSIDHNHTTGKVRGLLCWRCNAMIGYSRDSVVVLKNAIDYLNEHGE